MAKHTARKKRGKRTCRLARNEDKPEEEVYRAYTAYMLIGCREPKAITDIVLCRTKASQHQCDAPCLTSLCMAACS